MELNSPAKQFEIGVQDGHNHTTVAESFERYHLVYQINMLISVTQDPGPGCRRGPSPARFRSSSSTRRSPKKAAA